MEQPPFQKNQLADDVSKNAPLGENEVAATPEQQAMYEDFVINGMELLHGKGTRKQIVEQMKAEGGVNGVARTLVMVINNLEEGIERQGVDFPQDLVIQAGKELMGQALQIAESADVIDEVTPEIAEEVLVQAVDLYMGKAKQRGQLNTDWMEDFDPEAAAAGRELGLGGQTESPPMEEAPPPEMAPPQEMMGGPGLLGGL